METIGVGTALFIPEAAGSSLPSPGASLQTRAVACFVWEAREGGFLVPQACLPTHWEKATQLSFHKSPSLRARDRGSEAHRMNPTLIYKQNWL